MSAAPESITIEHEYISDETFAPRLSRSFTILTFTRPLTLTFYGLLALMAVLVLVTGAMGNELALLEFVFVLVATLAAITITTVRIRNRIVAGSPVGSRYAVGLGEAAMRVEGPLASGEISYRAYRRALVRDGFVYLHLRSGNVYSTLPLELFPGDAIERLRAGIARARPQSTSRFS